MKQDKKCKVCGKIPDPDIDSAETIRLIGKCEDCMTDCDWRLYGIRADAEEIHKRRG